MQTFLVDNHPHFHTTMKCLDNKRLGKQRVEAMQILDALQRTNGGWINHPATVMWRGYATLLMYYHDRCIEEWKLRGFTNTMQCKLPDGDTMLHTYPHWWHDERVYASHRSNLLRKHPTHYEQFNWHEPDNLPYHWPT